MLNVPIQDSNIGQLKKQPKQIKNKWEKTKETIYIPGGYKDSGVSHVDAQAARLH